MTEYLPKLALVVALTHAFRSLSVRVGPRWAGLALGLPCSTAIALVGSGSDQGVAYAREMAETSLLGLVGAVAVPLAYARSVSNRWKFPWPPLMAVGAYMVSASIAGLLAPRGSGLGLVVALLAVTAATAMAGRIAIPEAARRVRVALGPRARTCAIRTTVPALCLLASLTMGRAFGPGVAGLTSTFPALTLTVLILTHLEGGAGAVVRIARTLPPANLGMLAFLGVFGRGVGPIGLAGGTALAYLAAVATLGLVAWLAEEDGGRVAPMVRPGRPLTIAIAPSPRSGRTFSPRLESLAA